MLALAAALLLATAGVGAALAREETGGAVAAGRYGQFAARVAKLLGQEPADVRSAMDTAQRQLLDEAAARGEITPERAAKLKQHIGKGGAPIFRQGRRGIAGVVTRVEGQTLTLRTREGERTVRLSATTEVRQKGEIVQPSAIQVGGRVLVLGRADAEGVVAAERVRLLPVKGAKRGVARAAFREQFDETAAFLGHSPDDLRAQLRAGKSLAAIAGPGKTADLIGRLTTAGERRIDAAVSAGRLKPERAATLKERLPERVTKLVNRERKVKR